MAFLADINGLGDPINVAFEGEPFFCLDFFATLTLLVAASNRTVFGDKGISYAFSTSTLYTEGCFVKAPRCLPITEIFSQKVLLVVFLPREIALISRFGGYFPASFINRSS
jgi:hypothetical protein